MPANVDGLVREGVSALKAGQRVEAREALMKAVELDERNETAWMWLSGVVESLEERQVCLENVLQLNPGNENARRGLEDTIVRIFAKKKQPQAFDESASDALARDNPFAETGFDENPYAAGVADDPALSGWTGYDTPATSVEWGPPPSGTQKPVADTRQPTQAEYDDWMKGLSLDNPVSAPAASASPFMPDEDETAAFFSANTGASAVNSPAALSGFEEYFNAPNALPVTPDDAAEPFSDNAFNQAAESSEPVESSKPVESNKPAGSSKPVSAPFDFGNSVPVRAPAFDAHDDRDMRNFDDLDALRSTVDFDEMSDDSPLDETQFADDLPMTRVIPPPMTTNFVTVDTDAPFVNPTIYFQQIPDDIQLPVAATPAAPAEPQAAPPRSLTVSLLVLAVLNIVSLLLLIFNLSR